jgi:hypothetical protein
MKKFLSLALLTGALFFFGCAKSPIVNTTTSPTTGEVTVEWKTYENKDQ